MQTHTQTQTQMQHVDTLPTIYGVEKNGKTKVWMARIYRDVLNDNATAEIEYGQLDGKKQVTTREYTEGKNLGKKNETTPLQQCILETRRKWQDKMEKEGYYLVQPVLESESNVAHAANVHNENAAKVFPMLAHTYEPSTTKHKKNGIVFPCYVQPKLDGLRCICYMVPNGSSGESKVVAQSRTGAYFETVEHICAELRPILMQNPGLILDGELYTAELPFEELAGLIKRKKASGSDVQRIQLVKYHIYDIVVDGDYSERHARIVGTVGSVTRHHLEVVDTRLIHGLTEFRQAFGEYVAAGYEGIMLRNTGGMYCQNYRSHDLQKYKEFLEAEYPIVGFKEAAGRDAGTVIWVCRTSDDREFSVRPRGTQEQRRQWFQDAPQYVGKLLTVIYQELSELNVPRFPVGKAIRDGY